VVPSRRESWLGERVVDCGCITGYTPDAVVKLAAWNLGSLESLESPRLLRSYGNFKNRAYLCIYYISVFTASVIGSQPRLRSYIPTIIVRNRERPRVVITVDRYGEKICGIFLTYSLNGVISHLHFARPERRFLCNHERKPKVSVVSYAYRRTDPYHNPYIIAYSPSSSWD
jgi:hypothetical protein